MFIQQASKYAANKSTDTQVLYNKRHVKHQFIV